MLIYARRLYKIIFLLSEKIQTFLILSQYHQPLLKINFYFLIVRDLKSRIHRLESVLKLKSYNPKRWFLFFHFSEFWNWQGIVFVFIYSGSSVFGAWTWAWMWKPMQNKFAWYGMWIPETHVSFNRNIQLIQDSLNRNHISQNPTCFGCEY